MNEPLDDAQVRDLLRSARVGEPMPGDVAARLDDVLAGLAPSAAPPVAPVLPLRRRLAPKLLAAAAAVVLVGGVGVGLSQVTNGGADESAAGGQAFDAESGGAESAPPAAPSPATTADKGVTTLDNRTLSRAEGPELREAARALVEGRPVSGEVYQDLSSPPGEADDRTAPEQPTDTSTYSLADCPSPALAKEAGALREVVLVAAVPALLVVGPVADGVRPVELWSCESDARLATDELAVDAAE